eukprot:Blabericola_migrator_1__11990@NODE_735_length_6690_cov_180_559112_g528_i0_p1_GENE_NODE_735_length_6690_cov_180_559112_g528_i0NODE_735_length_6690_cov_180_559112_g528_i0_p1_ORF_typecomplete_len975_score197_58Ank_2/PF12796_7/1e10Ank_2/PF12796_7/3_4e05Ank_2/PF12796_7/8_6e06Ank_4/PF13637_6/0_066Ank_4/PF13637_6/7_2e06Ank_4/PF13637_6/4_6e06Ank_4/PF13637_6/4_1e02Ank_5/PF13857_6/3_3Ank_5/PF13857_6/8_7e06Ank_5/PF13857_6/0_00013Ank_5/PF13857_6/6e02Ank_3/PF13606_6/41Ank_3/PF13606_6/0_0036Ank_3/PF13606_6/1_
MASSGALEQAEMDDAQALAAASPATTTASISPRKSRSASNKGSSAKVAEKSSKRKDVSQTTTTEPAVLKKKRSKTKPEESEKARPTEAEAPEAAEEAQPVDVGSPSAEAKAARPSARSADATSTSQAEPAPISPTAAKSGKISKSKASTKQLSPEVVQLKGKISALISKQLPASAYEIFAGYAAADLESCFPRIVSGGLEPGSPAVPGPENLAAILSNVSPSADDDEKEPSLEYLRDIALAGAFIGSSEVIEECLKKGADLTMEDSSKRNIFHILAATGNTSLLRKVLRRLEKTHGSAALLAADQSKGSNRNKKSKRPNNLPEISFAEVVNAADHKGWTPLLVAVCRNNVEAAEALLSHPQLDAECCLTHSCPPCLYKEDCQSSAIHFAAIQGNANLVKRLLVCGVPISHRDSMGRNVFHYAAALADYSLAASFLEGLQEEPQFDKSLLLTTDIRGRSPIFVAIVSGNLAFLQVALKLIMTEAPQPPAAAESPDDPPKAVSVDSGHEDSSSPPSLVRVLLAADDLAVNPLQLAYLRNHHQMIYGLTQLWSKYAKADDQNSFVQAVATACEVDYKALCVTDGVQPTAHRILLASLEDQTAFAPLLEKDLTQLEVATHRIIMSSLAQERMPPVNGIRIMRAVRAVGVTMNLRCLNGALDLEKRGGVVLNQRRLTLEGVFYHQLKTVMETELAESTVAAHTRFIHVDKPAVKTSAREQFRADVARDGQRGKRESVMSDVSLSDLYGLPSAQSPPLSRPGARRSTQPAFGPSPRSSSLSAPTRAGPTVPSARLGAAVPGRDNTSPKTLAQRNSLSRSMVTRPQGRPMAATPQASRQLQSNIESLRSPVSKTQPVPRIQQTTISPSANAPRFAAPTYSALANSRLGVSQSVAQPRTAAAKSRPAGSRAKRNRPLPDPRSGASGLPHQAISESGSNEDDDDEDDESQLESHLDSHLGHSRVDSPEDEEDEDVTSDEDTPF